MPADERRRALRPPAPRSKALLAASERSLIIGAQRLAFDKLHRDEVQAVSLADFIDRDQVRMIQRRERLRLALETIGAFSVGDELRAAES